LGGALDLLVVHSRLLDQPQKKNGSALSQSGQMGPTNYRGQRASVYDGLHKKRERQSSRRKEDTQPDKHRHTKDVILYVIHISPHIMKVLAISII